MRRLGRLGDGVRPAVLLVPRERAAPPAGVGDRGVVVRGRRRGRAASLPRELPLRAAARARSVAPDAARRPRAGSSPVYGRPPAGSERVLARLPGGAPARGPRHDRVPRLARCASRRRRSLASAAGWVDRAARSVPRTAPFAASGSAGALPSGAASLVAFVPLSLARRACGRAGSRSWSSPPCWSLGGSPPSPCRSAVRGAGQGASVTARERSGSSRLVSGARSLWLLHRRSASPLYALRALTEPMWSNDFLAIWGLKGKTIFVAGGVPRAALRTRARILASRVPARPSVPLRRRLVSDAAAGTTTRWRCSSRSSRSRRSRRALRLAAPARASAAAAALSPPRSVACFEPLYSAFLTGMAEVPLAFGMLLFGTALADALDETDGGRAPAPRLRRGADRGDEERGPLPRRGGRAARAARQGAPVEGRAGGARPGAPRARPPPAVARPRSAARLRPGLFSSAASGTRSAAAASCPGWPAWAGSRSGRSSSLLGTACRPATACCCSSACARSRPISSSPPSPCAARPGWSRRRCCARPRRWRPLAAAAVAVRFPREIIRRMKQHAPGPQGDADRRTAVHRARSS